MEAAKKPSIPSPTLRHYNYAWCCEVVWKLRESSGRAWGNLAFLMNISSNELAHEAVKCLQTSQLRWTIFKKALASVGSLDNRTLAELGAFKANPRAARALRRMAQEDAFQELSTIYTDV